MKDLVPHEEHSSFLEATSRAKEIAYENKVQTGVRRGPHGWIVWVPYPIARSIPVIEDGHYIPSEFTHYTEEDTGNYGCLDDETDPRYFFDNEINLTFEDIETDRDDWARSEEEGWYYEE